MSSKFNIGERVKVVHAHEPWFKAGEEGVVVGFVTETIPWVRSDTPFHGKDWSIPQIYLESALIDTPLWKALT